MAGFGRSHGHWLPGACHRKEEEAELFAAGLCHAMPWFCCAAALLPAATSWALLLSQVVSNPLLENKHPCELGRGTL